MIFSQIANPNPVPSPIFFVVKKGSKILFFDSSVMPIPVSVMEISNHLPSSEESGGGICRVLIVSTPPWGMASRALVIRLRKRVWRWVGSPKMGGRSGEKVSRKSYISRKKPGFTQMDQFFQNFIHIQRPQLGFGLSGKREEVFNRIGQPVQLRFDDFESISIFGLKISILKNELNVAGDRVQEGFRFDGPSWR